MLSTEKFNKLRQDIVFGTQLGDETFTFHTTWGIFSPREIDEGTRLLVDRLEIAPGADCLDLGCGYGPIGLFMARRAPKGRTLMVDKDFMAVEYSNANAFRNEVSVGGKTIIPENRGYRYLRSQFSFTRFDENYYDRDDGQDQLIGTTDVSDRFNRTRIGPSIYYHRKRTKLGYGWRAEGYANDYADTLDYLDLSNQQYLAGVHVSYYPWRTTEIRTGFDWSRREYSRRKAKSSSGIRFANNDDLEYDYQNYQATLRQKLWPRTSTVLSYRYTIRDDNFEGYDDYTRHTGRASLRF